MHPACLPGQLRVNFGTENISEYSCIFLQSNVCALCLLCLLYRPWSWMDNDCWHIAMGLQVSNKSTSQMPFRCKHWLHHAVLSLFQLEAMSAAMRNSTQSGQSDKTITEDAFASKKSSRHLSNESCTESEHWHVWEMSEGWAECRVYLPCYSLRSQRCPVSDTTSSTTHQAPGPGHNTNTTGIRFYVLDGNDCNS